MDEFVPVPEDQRAPGQAETSAQRDAKSERVWAHLDALAKPRRSLGKLEELAVRLAVIQRTLRPAVRPRRLVIFAGDHGVVARGVSAWPSDVTGLMVGTMMTGRAASSALAAAHECSLRLVDVGVASARSHSAPPFFRDARIAAGTRDLSVEPAMTSAQFDAAWKVGAEEAERAVAEGNRILLAGEMGIGNTTPAACLTMLFTGVSADVAVGRGAGADDTTLQIKREIVGAAVAGRAGDLRSAIEAVSGYELVAIAGFFAAGARLGATLLLDGYVATSAALIAEHVHPGSAHSMIAAHRSAEPGHGAALAHLGLDPLLDWNMRLGEGTGALVALPLLDSAAVLLRDVAALSDLGVARED
jgi:nicotinate-nucleotide--dimethylbenzimidazole phosphoribosyltransferase